MADQETSDRLTPPDLSSTSSLLHRVSGMQRATGRFRSHKEAVVEYQQAIKVQKRRPNTFQFSQMFTDDVDPISYGDKLFLRIMKSLANQHLQTARMRISGFEWLMPKEDATAEQLAIYDKLYSCAPIVRNDDLAKILSMEISTNASPPLEPNHSYFYIRTLEIDGKDFRTLIDYIRDSDDGFEEVDEWRNILNLHHTTSEGGTEVFTIRYVGTVKGPRRPIDRHDEDLLSAKTNSIMGDIFGAVEALFPALMEQIQVFLLSEATQYDNPTIRAEDVERVLIELMHPPTLLNRQRGGFYSSFLPSQDDKDKFFDLYTDVWDTFRQNATLAPPEMIDELADHFKCVQQYACDFPGETGTGRHDFTDDVLSFTETQATPNQYRGYTLATFVGKDITYTDYLARKTFWDGGSRAAVLTKDILQRIVDTEAGANDRGGYQKSISTKGSLWSFVDLWPWLWHKNTEQAIDFLRAYFGIVKPLIAISYSRPVNGVIRADFAHEHGVRSDTFTPIVGDLTIQYYGDPSDPNWKKEDNAFINIPHLHPGRDKYGEQDITVRRLMECTMQLTFAILENAMQRIDEYLIKNPAKQPSRLRLCKKILKDVKESKEESPFKEFCEAFEDARQQCINYFAQSQSRSSHDDVRPLLSQGGRLKLASLGQASGQPKSTERDEQLDKVWELNIPDLHITIAHGEENKKRWKKIFQDLQPGQYLFLAVLAQLDVEDDVYLQQLLDTFKPEGQQGRGWMKDKIKRGEAFVRAGLWISAKAQEANDQAQQFSRYDYKPQPYLPTFDLQNSPVGIGSNGLFRVRWLRPDKSRIAFTLSSKRSIPESPRDTRVLYFTAKGLDILGAQGQAFRTEYANGKTDEATIPYVRFSDSPGTCEMWTAVLNAHNIPYASDAQLAIEAGEEEQIDWGKKGVKALSQKAKIIDPPQNRPTPNKGDANYILFQFLELYFPQGGKFESVSADDVPSSPAHVDRFREFIKQSKYAKHPYRAFWLSAFDKEKPEMALLAKNIPLFRHCTADSKSVKSESRGRYTSKFATAGESKYATNKIFNIGPPGTALDDIFDESAGQSTISERYQKEVERNKRKAEEKKAAQNLGASTTGGDDDDADEDEDGQSGQLKRMTGQRRKKRASMLDSEAAAKAGKGDDDDGSEGEEEGAYDASGARVDTTKAPTKGRVKPKAKPKPKSKSTVEDDDDKDEAEKGPTPKSKAKGKKRKVSEMSQASQIEEDDIEEVSPPQQSKTQQKKARKRAKKERKEAQEVEDDDIVDQ